MQNPKPKIVICLEGGLIQNITSDIPTDIEIVIVDYDVEGAEESIKTDMFGDEWTGYATTIHQSPEFVDSIFEQLKAE